MTKKLFILVALFLFSGIIKAQNPIEKAWNFFKDNKISEAQEAFASASENPKFAKEAWLGLTLVNGINKPENEVFSAFSQFYALEKDPNPFLYTLWYKNAITGNESVMSKEVIKFVKSVLVNPQINPTVRAMANTTMGAYYQSLNNYNEASKYLNNIGCIMEWQFLGSFDNISESAFDKDFGAVEHPEGSYEFTNYNYAKVKWFTIPKYKSCQWITFGSFLPTGNTVAYAQTFVNSPKSQEVQMRFGASGSVKIWVNDVLMFQEKEERNNGIDAYIFTAKLEKGYNRILLQIGESSDVDESNFMLRITDNKGELIPNLSISPEPKNYPKNNAFESKRIPSFCEEYFKKEVEKDPSNIMAGIFLAEYYLMDDKMYDARKTILKNLENAPKMSYIINQLMRVYQREDAESLLSLELEKMRKNDPDNIQSLAMEFDELNDKKDYDKAWKVVDKLELILGATPTVIAYKVSLLISEEKINDAVKLINEGYKKYPNNYTMVQYKMAVAENVDKSVNKVIAILKKYMKQNWSAGIAEDLADYYFDLGRVSEGLAVYNKILENIPQSAYYKFQIGQIYNEQQTFEQAISYYKVAIERAPYFSSYHSALAQAYKETSEYDLSKKEYEKSLELNPENYDARRTYRKLMDKKAVYEYFEEPDLYKIYENSPSADEYPDDNSVILHYETQKVVYDGGGAEEKRFMLVKVFNASGVDDWKEYGVYADVIEKAEVLKKNGTRLKAEKSGGHMVFTNLEEGDAILLIYTIESDNSSKMLKHFWGTVYMQGFYPYKNIKYSLMVQGDQKFNYKVTNSELQPTISNPDEEFKMYVWENKDVPGIKKEDYMPKYVDFAPILHYSSIPDWEFIRAWYYDIYRTKTKADFEVKDVIETLFKDKKNLTQDEKVRIIYDYIVRNIRYSSVSFRQSGHVPQKAKKTINTRLGDCKDVSTLFIALCKEVGIHAEMVLVNTRDNGENEMVFPGYSFNHAIAKLYIDNKEYYIELTNDVNPFGTMGQSLKNSFALEIHDGKLGPVAPVFIDSKNRVRNASSKKSVVTFQDEKMIIKRSNTMYGDYAAARRGKYRDIGKVKREKEIAKEVGDEFPKVKLLESAFDTTVYVLSDSLYYTFSIEVSDYYTTYKDDQLIKIPFANKQKTLKFINDDNRKLNFNFWQFNNDDFETETIEMVIPNDKVLVEMPKDVVISCKYAEYTLKFKKIGNNLLITRSVVYKLDKVPVADFKAFSDFYSKVIKSDNETQIGFKKK